VCHHDGKLASTQTGRRPNPLRYAIAQAILHPISTANSSHPMAGWSQIIVDRDLKPNA